VTIIPGVDDERGWRTWLYVLTGVTSLVYLYHALMEPGTFAYTPYTIQDDTRQFLAWMIRLDDAAAMPDDLIANYWQSVCPPIYRAMYGFFNLIGLEPTLFARLLPVALLFFSAWMSWRVTMLLAKRPVVAVVASSFLVGFLLHEDSIYSSTPRAFSTPLFLVFLDGLLRNRAWMMIPSMLVLGLLYPTTAIVGLTMLAFSRIGWRPFRIDLSRRTWLLGAAAASVALTILLFPGSTSIWSPIISVSDALAMPNLGTPEGRSNIVGLSGQIDLLCQGRMGLLPEIVPCWTSHAAVIPNAVFMLPMLYFAWRAVRRTTYQPDQEPGEIVHAWALVASIAWWIVAIALAFSLHLPSRYTQRILAIFEFIAIGQLVGMWIDARLRQHRKSRLTTVAGTGLALFLLTSYVTPTPGLSAPIDKAAMSQIETFPPDTVIGGVSDQLDYLPALTGRSTLATIEHAIPYHTRYFGPLRERLVAGLEAVASDDPAVLGAYVERFHVDVIAVDDALLSTGRVPPKWATVVPDAVRAAQQKLDRGPSILQQRARACTLHTGDLTLLDAACLVRPDGVRQAAASAGTFGTAPAGRSPMMPLSSVNSSRP
jgi:hypothetical protein